MHFSYGALFHHFAFYALACSELDLPTDSDLCFQHGSLLDIKSSSNLSPKVSVLILNVLLLGHMYFQYASMVWLSHKNEILPGKKVKNSSMSSVCGTLS